MPTTLKDIARELNISVSTVSYALHGGTRKIPDQLREQVRETAVRMNYRPNRLARSLVTGRTNTIGVVPPVLDDDVFLSPYLRMAWNSIVNEAEKLRQDLLLLTASDRTRAADSIDDLVDSRIDGLLFVAPSVEAKPFERLTELQVPYTLMSAGGNAPGPHFGVDNNQGVRLAVQHLMALGHRRIAHIGGPDSSYDAIMRKSTFDQLVREYDLPLFDGQSQHGPWTRESGEARLVELMKLAHPPTAIFAGNDDLAIGVLGRAFEMGIRVPDKLSVIGFDDAGFLAYGLPGLTTVRQPLPELAALAVRSLVDFIATQSVPADLELPATLVVRESTGPAYLTP